jgi:hypothetical protein
MSPSDGQVVARTGEEAWALAFVRAYKAHPSEDCIPWAHTLASTGYGLAGRTYAHRLLYFAVKGPIPVGLELDHLCMRKDCVNARHLEAVDQAENKRRAHYSRTGDRTTCKHGHPWTPENIETRQGRKRCLTCRRERDRRQAAREKAERHAAKAASA